ncbi:asparagine synthase (glutamine-hydrolyzing), partial [candidate division KSB1 bacterium]|nr:asparagine synthase (glutamine-hydrolyzing) [candidate division KSB1 bacterium]
NIYKLPQAHWLGYQDGKIDLKRYWHLHYRASSKSEHDLADELAALLRDAVKIRLMSEVPLGSFLSGGLDSSSVVAMMAQSNPNGVKTFSIGFDDTTYNELPFARLIAKTFDTEHHEEIITPDAVALTEKIIHQLDEPFGDFSVFPTLMVSEMARNYVTVVLSGDGGDELIAGYETYLAERMARRYQKWPRWLRRGLVEPGISLLPPTEKKKGLINKSRRFIEGLKLPGHLQHVRWMIFLQQLEKERLYHTHLQEALQHHNVYDFIEEKFAACRSTVPLDQQEYVDIMSYLVDDILVKVDRMSMAVSLEARTPFLDYRFVEFCATIPAPLRFNGRTTKHILKKAMVGILPQEILQRRKEGFSIPIKNWMKQELRPMMLEFLSVDAVKKTGYFSPAYIDQLIKEHLSGRENHSHRLWALLMFQMWHRQYMG